MLIEIISIFTSRIQAQVPNTNHNTNVRIDIIFLCDNEDNEAPQTGVFKND